MRVEEIKKLLSREIEVRKEGALRKKIMVYEEDEEKYVGSFIEVIKKVLERWSKERQGEMPWYIDIWSMKMSVLTETYEYTIRGYDKSYYYDDKYIEEVWVSSLNKGIIEDDKSWFESEIMSKLIRAKRYDVKDFLNEYIYETYIKPVPLELYGAKERMEELKEYVKKLGIESIKVRYGEMMEQTIYEIEIKSC